MNHYVGNSSFNVSESELETAFGDYGKVDSVRVIKDRETGHSRGFAFVEMSDPRDGKNAIESLNLHRIDGRAITVNEARPRENNRR